MKVDLVRLTLELRISGVFTVSAIESLAKDLRETEKRLSAALLTVNGPSNSHISITREPKEE